MSNSIVNKFYNNMNYQNQQMDQPKITINELIDYVVAITAHNSEHNESIKKEVKHIKILDNGSSDSLDGVDDDFLAGFIFHDSLNKIAYHGILNTIKIDQSEKNISFFSSILSCILEKFNHLSTQDQNMYICRLIDKMSHDIRKKDGLIKFSTEKYIFHKKDLLSDLKNYETTENVISFISTYFGINIFIVNDINVNAYYTGYNFNKYKCTLILIKIKDIIMPLSYDGNYIWIPSYSPYVKLITEHKKYINIFYQPGSTLTKPFIVGDDDDIKEPPTTQMTNDIFIKSDSKEHIPIESEMITPKCKRTLKEIWEDVVIESYSQLTLDKIKKLSTLHKITLTKKVDGKIKPKTKLELIREMHNIDT